MTQFENYAVNFITALNVNQKTLNVFKKNTVFVTLIS